MSRTAARPHSRPLSPHLSIWKWGAHMLVSILHRMCGVAMATGGVSIFVWWLAALAAGPDSYASFHNWVIAGDGSSLTSVANVIAKLIAIGLTWTLFQHLANGVRHFVMDLGAGYELRFNKTSAVATIAFGIIATIVLWAYILIVRQ